MNIVVCVKQVPDVDDIKWTKENNLDRTLMLSKINPCDEWALNWALKIKLNYKEGKLTVISMGPSQAKDILNYSLAKGADRAILLSDKAFAASDTLITSKILAAAITKYVPDFNLILTGQAAVDGDTAQVPVGLATQLDIVDAINIVEIYSADKNMAIVAQKTDKEINVFEVACPCLLAINKECEENKIPKIEDYVRAQNAMIEIYNAYDLELKKTQIGIFGSPTTVYRTFRPDIVKDATEIKENQSKEILDSIFEAGKI